MVVKGTQRIAVYARENPEATIRDIASAFRVPVETVMKAIRGKILWPETSSPLSSASP